LTVRHAIATLVALSAAGCVGSGATPIDLPVAPPSAITVAAPTGTITGTAAATMIQNTSDCPPAFGVGLRASTSGADVTVVFPRWPDEGAIYDLSLPGTSDYVVVSARAGDHAYCVPDEGAAGSVVVNRFEAVGTRYLADVTLTGVTAGATTIDAHLYH
jgi:hypothetical protein